MTCKFFPIQLRWTLIFPPLFNQSYFGFYHYNSVKTSVHLKGVFAKTNLFLFIENQMVPGHFHNNIRAAVSAEKLREFRVSMIKFFFRWLDVNRLLTKTIRGRMCVSLMSSIGDNLQEVIAG